MKVFLELVKLRRAFLLIMGFAALSLMLLSSLVQQWLNAPLNIGDEGVEYTLQPGSSIGQAAYDLHRLGVLDQPRWLVFYARLADKTAVQAGEYLFASGTSVLKLLKQLQDGDVRRYSVTLVEGWTFQQALDHLHRQEKIKSLLKDLSQSEQLQQLALQEAHPEGWFFPDTYSYTAQTTDVELLQQAYRKMQSILTKEWKQRAKNLPYETPYQALIMASIVERETAQPSERQQIAGVFVRRLQKKMRLQTDPTVIYGLGPAFDGNIRRKHLSQTTPYNTYVIDGLPPTPIALPGRDSLHAALHPDDSGALYFVAKGDGSHHFSETLEEHNRAVRQYQIYGRAKNYHSAPNSVAKPAVTTD